MTNDITESIQPKSHVLVVDDENEICQMVSLCLQKAGHDVTVASSAEAAFELLGLIEFDAIVTDVMMPGQDGITFLGRVHCAWPDTPVILMTGYAQLQMAVNAIKKGAFDFIHKPFDFDHLRKIVERALNYAKLQKMEINYRNELEKVVTERTLQLKNAMIELEYLRAEQLRSATEKSNFMSNISHEMRTPMNGVVGALDLLSDGGIGGIQAEYLEMARQSANSMLAMINQLLTFNDGVGGAGAYARYDLIDLNALLEGCVAEFTDGFKRKGLFLNLQIAEDVPGKIWTDREQLKRLLEILLGNALKFTDRGGAAVEVSTVKSEKNIASLQFSISDSGIGIPEGMLERIFEPFVQGDGSLTRRHDGSGLGLSIAKQYVRHLNGSLLAEHIPDGGSRFTFVLEIIDP